MANLIRILLALVRSLFFFIFISQMISESIDCGGDTNMLPVFFADGPYVNRTFSDGLLSLDISSIVLGTVLKPDPHTDDPYQRQIVYRFVC